MRPGDPVSFLIKGVIVINDVVEIKFKLKDSVVKQKILDEENKIYGFLIDGATGELIREYEIPEPDMFLIPQTEEFWLEVPIPEKELDGIFEFDVIEFIQKNGKHIQCKVESYSIVIPESGRGVDKYIFIIFSYQEIER